MRKKTLRTEGVSLVYKLRKNMKPQEISATDALMPTKCVLIESVIKEIKIQNRSFLNFQVNAISAMIAYT